MYSGNGGVCSLGSHSSSRYWFIKVSGLTTKVFHFVSQHEINPSNNATETCKYELIASSKLSSALPTGLLS